MSAKLHCEPISEAAFAPFGLVLRRPSPGGPRLDLTAELQNRRPTAKPRFTLATAPPRTLPMVATRLERHVYSSQTFTPVDGAGYLVLVAPHGADGMPDIAGLKAFHVPRDVGVHYFADTWHHPLTPLERPATFTVLTFIDGGPTDEEWFDLPSGIDIVA
jgi:ureidoglycolate lyase